MKSTVLNFNKKVFPSLNLNSYKVYLFYGPNYGLATILSEMVIDLCSKNGLQSVKILSSSMKGKENAFVLKDEIFNKGMFDENKCIKMQEVDNYSLEVIESYLNNNDMQARENIIVITLGALDTKSKIRKLAELNDKCICVPCYEDDINSSKSFIDEWISKEGLSCESPNVVDLIAKKIFDPDRMSVKNELNKLKIFMDGKNEILESHIEELFPDRMEYINGDIFVNLVISKKINEAISSIHKIEGDSLGAIANLLLRSFFKLMKIKSYVKSGMSKQDAVKKEFIFFKSVWAYNEGILRWSDRELYNAINLAIDLDIKTKQRSSDNEMIEALLNIFLFNINIYE